MASITKADFPVEIFFLKVAIDRVPGGLSIAGLKKNKKQNKKFQWKVGLCNSRRR